MVCLPQLCYKEVRAAIKHTFVKIKHSLLLKGSGNPNSLVTCNYHTFLDSSIQNLFDFEALNNLKIPFDFTQN